jgi:hypothetical protein
VHVDITSFLNVLSAHQLKAEMARLQRSTSPELLPSSHRPSSAAPSSLQQSRSQSPSKRRTSPTTRNSLGTGGGDEVMERCSSFDRDEVFELPINTHRVLKYNNSL